MKKYRIIQILTGVHYIHHLTWSYGYKLPFLKIGWFENYGWRYFGKEKYLDRKGNPMKSYHNCTITGTY